MHCTDVVIVVVEFVSYFAFVCCVVLFIYYYFLGVCVFVGFGWGVVLRVR